MNVYDNLKYIKYIEDLKSWYKSYPSDMSQISGCLEGYLDCLESFGMINFLEKADIIEATLDYITGFKSELSPYED